MTLRDLPTLNACLNASSAGLLAFGFYCIRRRRVTAHRRAMLGAVASSTAFLSSYLVYHFQVGSVRYGGAGWTRTLYLAILATHTLLAMALPFLVGVTLTRALRGRFPDHKRLARITLPLWAYVSVTGVVIYWMLYRLG